MHHVPELGKSEFCGSWTLYSFDETHAARRVSNSLSLERNASDPRERGGRAQVVA